MKFNGKHIARVLLAVGSCLTGFGLSAKDAYLKYGVKDGHFADPTIWQNDTPPTQGDTVRLYWSEVGGTVIVSTEADWTLFSQMSEAVLYYGAQLTLDTATDRTITTAIAGGQNGKKNRLIMI